LDQGKVSEITMCGVKVSALIECQVKAPLSRFRGNGAGHGMRTWY
jgi:hypothetical protein